ncbi:MAG: endonuclease/exonuclease/phosphatase family protein [Synergistales bacterium]|nr:endonuclease/exonuclease/phosphatase family protein [Synergistales bacterium]
MRIVIYNIRYGTGTGLHYHMPIPFSGFFAFSTKRISRIADFLDSLDADIVCLVEVDGGSYRHRKLCQAHRLASLQGWEHHFSTKYGKNSILSRLPLLSSQGNAILTRLPVVASREHHLARGMKKTVLEVEFPEFHVLVVHLPLGKSARRSQLKELARKLEPLRKPVLLGGDFNLLHGSSELNYLLSATGMRDADTAGTPTYPSRVPRFRLDRLLVRKEISVRNFTVPRIPLSDHLPIVCDFEIGTRNISTLEIDRL